MRSREFLIERVVNLLKPEDKEPYIDTVTDILHKSYAKIGGYKNLADREDLRREVEKLAQKDNIWKLIRKDGEIVTASIYKFTNMGRKALATGTYRKDKDDLRGKDGVYQIKGEDITQGRMYAEVSDRMEQMLIDELGAKPIPAKYASVILGKDVEPLEDGYHYNRELGGEIKTKILVGRLDDQAWEWVTAEADENPDILIIDKAA